MYNKGVEWDNNVNSTFFRGASNVTIDAKGRLAIPSRYRQVLNATCKGELVITADEDGCLLLYPKPAWQRVEKELMKLPTLKKQSRFLQRLMIGYATDCEIDSHGRISLTPPLREHAKLQKQGLFMGQGRRFELWDQKWWERERATRMEEKSSDREIDDALGNVSF